MKFLFTITFLLISITAAQVNPVWPLGCKPQITSTFAEFRVGHFHAGVDFRTPDGEGSPIFAIGDGSVIRVRETPWGYGKVVYFRMDDGITAVYAHLSGFAVPIEKRIRAEKIKKENNTIELWFKEGEFEFDAGDTLGFSGSTGAGSAHLHFELREGMDSPFNPMFVGYSTQDELSPTIEEIWAIPRGDNAHIEGFFAPKRFKIESVGGKSALAAGDKIFAHGPISLSIKHSDREGGDNYNSYGAYEIFLIANDDTIYHFHADTFSYSRTKQIGLLYDLPVQEEAGLKRPPLRLEHPVGADVALLEQSSQGDGIINIAGDTVQITIALRDFRGNSTRLDFDIIPHPIPVPPIRFDETKKALISFLSPKDTSAFKLEYESEGGKFRGKIPTEEKPLPIGSEWEYVELRHRKSGSIVYLFRPGKTGGILISTRIYGEEAILIEADFDTPPIALPLLLRGDIEIRPQMIEDTAFVFRVFDPEPGESFKLDLPDTSIEIEPRIWRFESGTEYTFGDGRWRIEIPERGVFSPFIARDTIMPPDSTSPERIVLGPPGVILRLPATILFETTEISADSGKICLVRFWKGDTFFVSNEIDEDGRLFGKISALGTFAVVPDTTPPELKLGVSKGEHISHALTASVSDNLSGFSRNILPNSYIDGVWLPTEYDPDKNRIVVDIENIESGEHLWKVVAADVAGNAVIDSVRFKIADF